MSILSQLRTILGKNEGDAAATVGTQDAPVPTPPPSEPAERRRRKRLYSHKGRRVLIVDDSPTIVAALRKMLRSAGCLTIEASSAESALELLRREKPELVFLDIVLPGINGFAALRQIRRDPLTMHIPVIMISGNEQATEQFYVKRIGADDFMKKPFARHEVFARMENLIDVNKLRLILELDDKLPRAAAGTAVSAAASTIPKQAATPPPVEATADTSTQAAVAADVLAPVPTGPAVPAAAPPAPITAMQARKHLTEMGLQYFNQEQYAAAVARGDLLAVELFVAGGCIDVTS